MTSLHIIDQSLTGKGGHHFDYVCCLLDAAQAWNVPIGVGTHYSFDPNSLKQIQLCNPIPVSPCFRNTTYQKVSYLAGLQHLKRADMPVINGPASGSALARTVATMKASKLRGRRRRLIARFASDMRDYFRSQGVSELTSADHVFLTTVSELELMGLAIFLSTAPWTIKANWHLQFHYNLYEGRSPQYETQAAVLKRVRGCFLAALSRVSDHRLNFYCTTDELVRQYDELRAVQFQKLVYPIDPRFEVSSELNIGRPLAGVAREADRPVQIVCPGELRREKGHTTAIQPLVDDIWEDVLAGGKAQLAVQRPRRNWPRKQKLRLDLPGNGKNCHDQDAIKYIGHPLPKSEYVSLIENADVGVLFHNAKAYFSRRAGVLGELLACGKPVVVPAGSWLSRQISESNFTYLESLARALRRTRVLDLSDLEYDSSNVPLSGGKVSFDEKKHPFKASFQADSSENLVMVWFKWHDPDCHGVDAAVQLTSQGITTQKVVGHRDGREPVGCLFRLNAEDQRENEVRNVEVRFANAFHPSTATVSSLRVELYRAEDPLSVPESAVGVCAWDSASYAAGLREILDHLEHYQSSARLFARSWAQAQQPVKLLQQLTGLQWQSGSAKTQRIA